MGMPACRISDLTEHGGTILVGFPQVLIGDLPASRIGDMHECPMVTPGVPPIPHVGGPFVLGSPTVLVGMMPQSRVTDTLVCVGPPDQAVLGCETVLVGMAGGAGAAGAGAGVSAMGVAVPVAPAGDPSTAAAGSGAPAQTRATMQQDGSVSTASTAPGKPLPPIALKQPGWPDLPPENTATFTSVQPATVLPGTQLFAPGDADAGAGNSYWTTQPPGVPGSPAGSNAASGVQNNSGYLSSSEAAATLATTAPMQSSHVGVLTVNAAAGLKAWAGSAASGAPGMQVWAPPAAAVAAGTVQKFRLPSGSGS
jgi:uncharacterized Zn-binding protein involved in type VI secretion